MYNPTILNLVIKQGSDFNDLTFQLAHKCITRCAAKPSTTPAQIKIEPMGVTLSTGSILIHGCEDLVLSAPLNPEDRVISVTSIPSSIPVGSAIQGPFIDITGWSIRSTIKDKAGLVIANFVGVIDDALKGRFKVTLSSSVTSGLTSNCDWTDLQNVDITTLGQPIDSLTFTTTESKKRFKRLFDSAYYWDLETVDTSGIVNRRSEGLVLVTSEVTK